MTERRAGDDCASSRARPGWMECLGDGCWVGEVGEGWTDTCADGSCLRGCRQAEQRQTGAGADAAPNDDDDGDNGGAVAAVAAVVAAIAGRFPRSSKTAAFIRTGPHFSFDGPSAF